MSLGDFIYASANCHSKYLQMLKAHQSREKAIKSCIGQVASSVDKLREQKDKDWDNVSLNLSLRQEQYKVRKVINMSHVLLCDSFGHV